MIDKFLTELESELKRNKIEDDDILITYRELYNKYINLGQSEFDIIRHFGEPMTIVANYMKTGEICLPNMDGKLDFALPDFMQEEEAPREVEEVKKENLAPTTKGGMIANDILFVGLGLVFAIAGTIALLTVSVLMTASSIVQMVEVWKLAEMSARVGGFFLALMALVASILFYVIIVWIVKAVIKFMKRYARDHKENWAKCNNA